MGKLNGEESGRAIVVLGDCRACLKYTSGERSLLIETRTTSASLSNNLVYGM